MIDFGEHSTDAGSMSSMKIDSEAKRRLLLKVQRELPFLIEFGNDDDIIACAKLVDPTVSPEQLKRIVKLFHDAKRGHGHSPQSR